MDTLRTVVIESATQLRTLAPAWDQIWQRSACANPTNQAEHLAHWLEQFAPTVRFRAVAIEEHGRWVAALPLIQQRWLGTLPVAAQLANPWAPQGDLLLDVSCDQQPALRRLLREIARLGWPLLWQDDVALDAAHWRALLAAAAVEGMPSHTQPRLEIGTVEMDQSWADYRQRWGKNHRRNMKRALERADELGGVTLQVITQPKAEAVPGLLQRAFAVEDSGWKGAAGSSILRTPGMLEFYTRQAQQLVAQGEFCLVFLEQKDQLIAFEYAWLAKGCYFPLKVAYDENCAELVPGQLLRALLFEQFFAGNSVQNVDFTGPLVEATAKWSTSKYRVGRLAIAVQPLRGRAMLTGYWAARALKHRLSRPACDGAFKEVELGVKAKTSTPTSAMVAAAAV